MQRSAFLLSFLLAGCAGTSFPKAAFEDGLLDFPHYTRPEQFEDKVVPPVLMSGDHQAIERWRKQQSLLRTLKSELIKL